MAHEIASMVHVKSLLQGSPMKNSPTQLSIPSSETPAELWDKESTNRALDELFKNVRRYKSTKSYKELIDFISRFRFYAPYNGMLIHIQMSGAKFVAPANRWERQYGRFVKSTARPLVILQPGGPVMFVFDVADTEPQPQSKELPPEVDRPFEVFEGIVGSELWKTIENAKRDGVRIQLTKEGSQISRVN